jgi:hypothetical protein
MARGDRGPRPASEPLARTRIMVQQARAAQQWGLTPGALAPLTGVISACVSLIAWRVAYFRAPPTNTKHSRASQLGQLAT